MDYYEADTEEGLDDHVQEINVPPLPSFPQQSNPAPAPPSPQQQQQTSLVVPIITNPYYTTDPLLNEDSNEDSDYSLDYEYLGPRHPVYREHNDADSDASELSSNFYDDTTPSTSAPFIEGTNSTAAATAGTGFDMWDEDPYSTNDFTWESNDMRLTHFIKAKHRRLLNTDRMAPWNSQTSFWRKEKGWPRQLPYSSTTTNHDQSANALCLVPTNYGLGEQLYGIYRDRIVECGRPWSSLPSSIKPATEFTMNDKSSTTWLDSDAHHSNDATATTTTSDGSNMIPCSFDNNNSNTLTSSSISLPHHISGSSSSSSDGSKFCSTHISISLKRSSSSSTTSLLPMATTASDNENDDETTDPTATSSIKSGSYINKFIPYTKYIKRSDFTPPTGQQHAYLNLGFEPLCLEHKYGYMAIGGLEGEFELYCCMDKDHPVKIWGTKFKGRDNIMLMTNAIQIVRWKRNTTSNPLYDSSNNNEDDIADDYDYFLLACMNEAGILVYKLPPHQQCLTKQQQSFGMKSANSTTTTAQLYAHLQSFDHLPINDAKVSPDGSKMVCVGDDGFIFMVNIYHRSSNPTSSPSHSLESGTSTDMDVGDCTISFGSPVKLDIPASLLHQTTSPEPTATTDPSASSTTNSEVEGHAHSFNKINNNSDDLGDDMYSSATPYSSQHVVWSHSSEYFAHTSDTHHRVLVWRASTLDILCSIDAAGYTYAIKFHPYLDGVLAFTNRYGYFHTVDLNQVLDRTMKKDQNSPSPPSLFEFDQQTTTNRGHICNAYCIKETKSSTSDPIASSSSSPSPSSYSSPLPPNRSAHSYHHSAHHTNHLDARHEMTMIAFRGEKDRRLRILAKINGIQWSQDGCYLYVATKKRVLAYEFISWSQQYVHSLFGLAGQKIRQLLEKQHDEQQNEHHHHHHHNHYHRPNPHHHHQHHHEQKQQQQQKSHQERKRKKGSLLRDERKKRQGHGTPGQSSFFGKSEQSWHQQWSKIPQLIRHQVLNEVNLSTHW
ncbi:unnamed protein product [Absidia cylindrospora]